MNKDSVKQQMDDYPALDICDALFEWANEKDKMTIHRGEFLELSKKLAGLFAAAPAYKGGDWMALVEAKNEYIKILSDELDDVFGIAHAHGWRSKLAKEGQAARNKIAELEAKLTPIT
jgi:hypothetical protein